MGNIRLTYRDGFRNHPTLENAKDGIIQVAEIIEKSDYYPFGLKQKGNDLPDYSAVNKYKYGYGGKELNDELGLDLYDFGARNYDPALGRWLNVDPLAENSRRWTPYNYAYNNPIFFVDPDGMQAKKFEELKPVGDVNDLMVSNGYYETSIGDFAGAANFSGFYGNSKYQGGDHDPPGGKDRPFGQPNYEQKSTKKSKEESNAFVKFWSDFTGGSQVYGIHADAKALSTGSDGSMDWKGYAAYSLMQEKITNGGDLEFGRNLFGKSPAVAKTKDALGGVIVKVENSPYLIVQDGNKTFHISATRVKEYVKNPLNPNARWGDQVNFKKYGVPQGSKIIQGAGKGHKRTPTPGELKMFNKYFKN